MMRLISLVSFLPVLLGVAPWERETVTQWTTVSEVRILVNAPGEMDAGKATQLIVFALPNGNTIEQTMGCKLSAGMHWRYDIQHVAAQVRKLREIDSAHNIVVACVEAKGLSWPGFRKGREDNAQQIKGIVEEIAQRVTPRPKRIALACHSGGGSFISGFINSGDAIPEVIDRIVYLDANYSYSDEEHHGDKLLAWLKRSVNNQLVVIAYDDRNVTLNGKKIVSETGGTQRASHRMIERFKKDVELTEESKPPLDKWRGMNGQIEIVIHRNPELKILHTRLVELNGLIYAMTVGTEIPPRWGKFWGERAYSDLIAPAREDSQPGAAVPHLVETVIPERPKDALGGRAFMKMLAEMAAEKREGAIVKEITGGNVPLFLREFKKVPVHGMGLDGRKHEGVIEVMADYLALGSDEDFVRVPMTPMSAMEIAKAFGCSLPTRKMVNDIYVASEVKLEPKPLTERREAIETFVQHNEIIEQQRSGKSLGFLVAGIKKDVVITPRLAEKPGKVAIYGWHKLDGKPIQPLYLGHVDWYVDYSHGVRLVKGVMEVDGVKRNLVDVLKDMELSCVVSDEGVIAKW